MDVDMRLRPCTTTTTTSVAATASSKEARLLVDRLSSLPDELLIRILSLLPTKDAAAACVLSHRLRCVLPRLTSLDFDSKPICFCSKRSYRVEQFPSFVTFVDTVLQAHHQSRYLTRFRLAVGADFAERYDGCNPGLGGCEKGCYPDLKSTHINAWISFPLIDRFGLRELDLRIPMKEHCGGSGSGGGGGGDSYQLPPEIFTCETLEVLKLDIDLRLDRTSTMPSFHLPNLKQLELYVFSIPDDGFPSRLVASCPLLEDLTVETYCNRDHYINISSPSLRRLSYNVLIPNLHDTDNVLIHTPNLEYLEYTDDLAWQYSITNMNCLVKAHVSLARMLRRETLDVSFQQMLGLITPLSNVQHLVLRGVSTQVLDYVEVVDQLPVFHNLKCLELQYSANYWKVLWAFLKCSPVLETLVFPWGIAPYEPSYDYNSEQRLLDRNFCKTTQAIIPSCCRYYLKRILVKVEIGNERQIDLIQFLLRHALVLEELIIFLIPLDASSVDRMELESTLQNLPRASIKCSIRVQDEPFEQML